MKKISVLIIVQLVFCLNIFSQKINIVDMDIDEFVDNLKSGKSVDLKANYLWTGSIFEISIKENNYTEISIIKSKWLDKNTLNSYKVIIKTKDVNTIEKIKKIGLNKKIVIIAQISEIKENNIPVCIPLLIKEI